MKTLDSLGVFWTFESSEGKYQEEVDGIIFYGYWEIDFNSLILENIQQFKDIWNDFNVEVRPRTWEGRLNSDISIELKINKWSVDDWDNCLQKSLKWFINLGAEIAWCGGEYSGPSLDVFSDNECSNEVYAAYTTNAGYICNSGLNDEYKPLEKKDLIKLTLDKK